MEEDINILEDMLNDLKERVLPGDVYILKQEQQALENLLKEYKCLKKESELYNFIKCMFNKISHNDFKRIKATGLYITYQDDLLILEPIKD